MGQHRMTVLSTSQREADRRTRSWGVPILNFEVRADGPTERTPLRFWREAKISWLADNRRAIPQLA